MNSSGGESPPAPLHSDQSRSQSVMSDRHDKYETGSEGSGGHSPGSPDRRPLPAEIQALAQSQPPPQPVAAPPQMAHGPSHKPRPRPAMYPSNQNLDNATMSQLQDLSLGQRPPYQMPNGDGARPASRDKNYNPYSAYSPPEQAPWIDTQQGGYPAMVQQHYPPNSQQPSRGAGHYPQQSRLAVIPASPASPYATAEGQAQSTSYFQQPGQIIQEHPQRPNPPQHMSSGNSVSRKPVPGSAPTGSVRPNGQGEAYNPYQQGPAAQPMNMGATSPQYGGYGGYGGPSSQPAYYPQPSGPPPATGLQQQMGPPPTMMMYGGHMVQYIDAMAMRKRDLATHGPDYVKAMERAPQVTAFREPAQRPTHPQDRELYRYA